MSAKRSFKNIKKSFPSDVNKDFDHKDMNLTDKDKDRDMIYTDIKDQQVHNIDNQGGIYTVATRITCPGQLTSVHKLLNNTLLQFSPQ
jgi:hypothetical protein